MLNDRTVTEQLFQSLLDHFWKAREGSADRDVGQYPGGYCVSYGQLVKVSGVPLDPRNTGGPLFEVAEYCVRSGWPPIHSLVVRAKEGDPGTGYFRAKGTELDHLPEIEQYAAWVRNVRMCANFDEYPKDAPRLT